MAVVNSFTSKLDSVDKYLADVSNSWYVILMSVGVCLVMGFVYLCLLRCLAGIIVFVTIMAYLLGLAVAGYLFYQKGTDTTNGNTPDENMKYVAYLLWGICALSALIFCCLRKTLRLAVAIVKTAGLFLGDVKSVLMVPICT